VFRQSVEVDCVHSSFDLASAEGDDSFAPLVDRLLVFATFQLCHQLRDYTWESAKNLVIRGQSFAQVALDGGLFGIDLPLRFGQLLGDGYSNIVDLFVLGLIISFGWVTVQQHPV
jgi:hypothetical protein